MANYGELKVSEQTETACFNSLALRLEVYNRNQRAFSVDTEGFIGSMGGKNSQNSLCI